MTFGWFLVSPTHEECRECHNLDNRSGGSLTSPSSLSSPVSPHDSSFSHLPRRVTAIGAIGGHEPTVKPTSETEILDQREEEVIVREDCVPYVVSRPIPGGKKLRKVIITVASKDQGWSNYLDDYGTYRNSWTWFELSVGSPSKDSGERWCGFVVRNLHAHSDFKEHVIEITDGKLYEKARSGDVLTVWAWAKFPGWKNTVKKVTIRYVVG